MFGSYDQGSSDRGLTTQLWLPVNPDVAANDPRHGTYFLDDMLTIDDLSSAGVSGGRKLVVATSGSITAVDDEEYGVAAINAGAATDNQGAAVFWPGVTVAPAAQKQVCFETRLKAETLTNGIQFFAGLALSTLDTTPVTAGNIASGATDYVGFYTADTTAVLFAAEDGGTQSLSTTTAHTFVNDTYVKLGFHLDGLSKINLFVDGAVTTHDVDVSGIPEGTVLRPVVACIAPGTSQPVVSVDWLAVGTS